MHCLAALCGTGMARRGRASRPVRSQAEPGDRGSSIMLLHRHRGAITTLGLASSLLLVTTASANEELYRKVASATALVYKNEGTVLGGTGTGFLIDAKERLVVTARHVVEKTAGGGVVPTVVIIFAQSKDGEIITEADHYRRNWQ